MLMTRRRALGMLGGSIATAYAGAGLAQAPAYPSRPIKMVVPFPPGGPADIIGRTAGQAITQGLGQPVVLDNRAGASGNIGSDLVAKSPADGYTLLVGNIATHAINPHGYKTMPYDAQKDFTPICALIAPLMCLAVHPSVQATTVAELIALAKRNPKSLSYASSGLATPHHLAGAQLCQMAGIDMVHIAYRGATPAATDLVGGQVPVGFISLATALPFAKAGRMRILAMVERTRNRILPDTPTVAETVPGFEMSNWQGLFGPAGLSPAIVTALHRECARGFNEPATTAQMENQGLGVIVDTPAHFADFVRQEDRKWGAFVRGLKLTLE
jgi:tripartite-type tricarboxylate transporter receptor subunit TctC